MGFEPTTSAYGYRFSLTVRTDIFKKYQLALKGEREGVGVTAMQQEYER